ncbi:MAG: prevent-host-death protein, partial [Alcaligenaceae bacterium]
MSVTTFSSRDFTRDVSAAKRAANDGPVFITDRGQPAFALLKI